MHLHLLNTFIFTPYPILRPHTLSSLSGTPLHSLTKMLRVEQVELVDLRDVAHPRAHGGQLEVTEHPVVEHHLYHSAFLVEGGDVLCIAKTHLIQMHRRKGLLRLEVAGDGEDVDGGGGGGHDEHCAVFGERERVCLCVLAQLAALELNHQLGGRRVPHPDGCAHLCRCRNQCAVVREGETAYFFIMCM